MITKISFLAGEIWWGGTTMHNYCPITEKSEYHQDFRFNAPNQTMPLFISDKGRVIWSDTAFKVDVSEGEFSFEGDEIILSDGGSTLKEAYLYAQENYFPCDGKELPSAFFGGAQYNSWIQFAYYPTQQGVLDYAHGIIDNGFEPGVLIIDEGWHQNTSYGIWEFDYSRFPDPEAMVEELHSLGFIVMLWVTPYITPCGPEFIRAINPFKGTDPESAKRIFKRNEKGEVAYIRWWNGVAAVLDLTDEYNRKYLGDKLSYLQTVYGIDGFKFDGGKIEDYSDPCVINGRFADGSTAAECNAAWNDFGTAYTYHEFKDTFKGGGKNAIQRLHDRDHRWVNNGIDDIIPCALTAGLIGHPFICPDMVGGGEWRNRYTPGFVVDEELFVRMAQCSALFPMIQFSWAPWEALSEENTSYCRDAAILHKKMAPEILSLVKKSEKSGEPILRPLEYNDPHQGYEMITDEYMVGEDILVAPVVTKGTFCRNVVFPEGRWQSVDGSVYEGRTECVLPAPLGTLLWFRRVTA